MRSLHAGLAVLRCDRVVRHRRQRSARLRPPSPRRLWARLEPSTGLLLASMNQRDDLGEHTPGDWLAAVRSGSNWRFPGCYGQGGAVCRGVPKPLAVLDPHAAAGGVAVVGDEVLVAEWQLGKVLEVPLAGGSVKTLVTGIENPTTASPSRRRLGPRRRLGDGNDLPARVLTRLLADGGFLTSCSTSATCAANCCEGAGARS